MCGSFQPADLQADSHFPQTESCFNYLYSTTFNEFTGSYHRPKWKPHEGDKAFKKYLPISWHNNRCFKKNSINPIVLAIDTANSLFFHFRESSCWGVIVSAVCNSW